MANNQPLGGGPLPGQLGGALAGVGAAIGSGLLGGGGLLGQKARLGDSGSWLGPSDIEVVVKDGDPQEELPILAQPEDYRPSSLAELVRETPSDIIQRTIEDLDKKPRPSHNGRALDPVPGELSWYKGAPLKTDVLYTMVRQVVQMELEQFARRIEEYYILVPRTCGSIL